MKVTRIIAAAVMSAVLAGTAQAQGPVPAVNCTGDLTSRWSTPCSIGNTVQANVPFVARMEMVSSTTLPQPVAADFGTDAGLNTPSSNPTVLTVRANAGYKVTATAAASTWTGPAGSSKASSDLRVFVNNSTSMQPLSTNGVDIFTESTPTAGTAINIGYNVRYQWMTDVPGNYSLAINYTLTAP